MYKVLKNLKHNCEDYKAGDVIKISSEKDAKLLLEDGAIEKIPGEPEGRVCRDDRQDLKALAGSSDKAESKKSKAKAKKAK
jgi:hypothetical protein